MRWIVGWVLFESAIASERPREFCDEIAAAVARFSANVMVVYDFDFTTATAKVEQDMRFF